jgi:type I restriction enzyme R subunit
MVMPQTVNFGFLKRHDSTLLQAAALAERYVFEDPNTALFKIRQLAELLAKGVAAQVGLPCGREDSFADVVYALRERGLLDHELGQIFRSLRLSGNTATHTLEGDRREAFQQLKFLRQVAIWFHKTVTKDTSFKPGPFVPPPDPADADESLRDELMCLREALAQSQAEIEGVQLESQQLQARVEQEAARAALAWQNEQEALALAEQTEAELNQLRAEFELRLEELAAQQAKLSTEQQDAIVRISQEAADGIDLDEFDTRKLIDHQLCEVGWEADSTVLKHSKGTRPQKGKYLAIAEWPTKNGIADYMLFAGLMPIAVIEAKRRRKNVRSAIDQAERYSKAFTPEVDHLEPGGPWSDFVIPFLFATNGRAFHRQSLQQTGVWFRDARRDTNHARPLTGWYSPEGLVDLLKLDVDAANARLKAESSTYLPLHYYQRDAIEAVENALAKGQTEILVAMATGTGKTRTAICLLYRLIKAGRFNRVLFLVDRTALGDQAHDSFRDVKLENYQAFTDIYEVKELGDLRPERETKLHISTIQAMVKRVVDPEDNQKPFPVDQYDLIVIDECHRGYVLDREMSELELSYRDQLDYVSKYRRVLDHYDSVRLGLTATPALHTTEIFGRPVYEYTYRRAVIDHFLVDHEPPYIIKTELSEKGMHWKPGETVQKLRTLTGEIVTEITQDDIDIDIDGFNRLAISKSFNEVVCSVLAEHLNPDSQGKTLIFCVNDIHADMTVDLLTKALQRKHGIDKIHHDLVKKITGSVDRPRELIKRYKNESLPKIGVTVELLTTGIDVPEIDTLVFLRCTRSRILYEQMMGRATRLCANLYGEDQHKEYFRIFDAVNIYATLQKYSQMRPVVVSPTTTFQQLAGFLKDETDPEVVEDVCQQFISKLRRKASNIEKKWNEVFERVAGTSPDQLAEQLATMSPERFRDWIADNGYLILELDRPRPGGEILVHEGRPDALVSVDRGYGASSRPEDYLDAFRTYLTEHQSDLPALFVVTQRPRDLTRADLKELQFRLQEAGFTETNIEAAVRGTTNQEIAATIIGYIRHIMLNEQLIPYESRVDTAINRMEQSHPWTREQQRWLMRIGKQLKENVIIDRTTFDDPANVFAEHGGFPTLNKVFDGKLDDILGGLIENIWKVVG